MPKELLADVNIGMQLMSSFIKMLPDASLPKGGGLALPVTPGLHTAAADTPKNECELEHPKCNFVMIECRSEI